MKLTVLVDNHTLIDRYLVGEPGVSYCVEAEGRRVLFDAGYSDVLLLNARKLSIDLLQLDAIVLSHGHLDHTWGLIPLIRLYTEAAFEGSRVRKPALVAHPLALSSRTQGSLAETGSLVSQEKLSSHFRIEVSTTAVWLTERLVFLGQIERQNDFEAWSPAGSILEDGVQRDDLILDDSALAYKSPEGLVIITGCAHAGICNTIEHAKRICGDERVVDIIGGFHLQNPSPERLQGTIEYMKSLRPRAVHACHCTDQRSKIALSAAVDLVEVGVGLTIEL
ncbi:MAG: MBL fold metallo-hydrolase [Acidobacteriota bacterium]